MTIFIAHASKDREIAEDLERFLERRGNFVELDDGETALRPVQAMDIVVLLVSQEFVFSPQRLRLEQRALDAWTEGRLILVKLDQGFAPVGLRDLPSINAAFEPQREFKWGEIAAVIRDKLRPRKSESDVAPPPQAPARSRGGGIGGALVTIALVLPGLLATAAGVSIWLVNRIAPAPGGWAELRAGVEDFGVRYGAPAGVTEWVFAAAIAIMLLTLVAALVSALTRSSAARRDARSVEAGDAAPPPPPSDAVFVSYARANAQLVLLVIEAAKRDGRKFWLDQDGVPTGEGWAGEIVRAIRAARGVLVMCSKAAFESDHVKREIYLADRYNKKLVPIFLEEAEPPEDFEYFFAGVQFLKLFETPEAERGAAVLRVLEGAA